MKIVVTAKGGMRTAEKGHIPKDRPTEVSEALGTFLIANKHVVEYESKAHKDAPVFESEEAEQAALMQKQIDDAQAAADAAAKATADAVAKPAKKK
jgi:hypothetical protein